MRDDEKGLLSFVLTLAAFVLVVSILRVGREVMVPIALASILAFLLAPLVVQLTRRGVGKTLAVILTAGLAFAIIASVGWVMVSQAWELVRELPKYEQNIDAKISKLKVVNEPSLTRVADMAARFEKELLAPAVEMETDGNGPLPVRVEPLKMSALGAMGQIAAPVLRPLATAGIVIIFVIAILLQRETLRDRFFRTVNPTWLDVVAQLYNDVTHRVSRYLRMQLVVNACFGAFVGLGLWAVGIPNVLLWGLFAMLLRFIPFLGPWLAAAGPLALAVAIDPGWSTLACTMGLYLAAELITANIVEIWLYGASTGISGLALLFAAIFWTWLWGPAGLFLSTPLTVCLMVTGRYVPGLNFLGVLLGSRPVSRPTAQFYHRLLAMDTKELLSFALSFIDEHTLAEFYNDVFVPALILFEEDRHAGAVTGVRQDCTFQSGRELVGELERRTEASGPPPAPSDASPVLGLPARDEADELVVLMARHLLRQRGIAVEVSPITASTADEIERLGEGDIKVAFVSGLPPFTPAVAAQIARKLRQKFPELKLVLGAWGREADVARVKGQSFPAPADELVSNLADLVEKIAAFVPRDCKPWPAAI